MEALSEMGSSGPWPPEVTKIRSLPVCAFCFAAKASARSILPRSRGEGVPSLRMPQPRMMRKSLSGSGS